VNFLDGRLPDRFWKKCIPEPNTGCWLWIANSTHDGYGMIFWGGGKLMAHRVSYERLIGPIPAGLQLDHTCRTRCCVNPAHLEPVTNRENQMRGVSFSAVNATKTHCPQGHTYDAKNTAVYKGYGSRVCRACTRARSLARYRRLRAATKIRKAA
jgi:hypothetical protein